MKVEAIELDVDLKKRSLFDYYLAILPHIPDPQEADLIVQLCQLQLIDTILQQWKEDIKITGIKAIQGAKYSAKKAAEQHYQELLNNLIKIPHLRHHHNFLWKVSKIENAQNSAQ